MKNPAHFSIGGDPAYTNLLERRLIDVRWDMATLLVQFWFYVTRQERDFSPLPYVVAAPFLRGMISFPGPSFVKTGFRHTIQFPKVGSPIFNPLGAVTRYSSYQCELLR